MGRGGRIILDRAHHDLDDFWRTVDFTIYEPAAKTEYEKMNNSRLAAYSSDFGQCDDRLRTSSDLFEVSSEVAVKSEPVDVKVEEEEEEEQQQQHKMVVDSGVKEEEDDVGEFLKTVRKEW